MQVPIVHKTISANFGVEFSLLFWFVYFYLPWPAEDLLNKVFIETNQLIKNLSEHSYQPRVKLIGF